MDSKTIDSKLLARMFCAGAASLDAKKEWINSLNVFPVPDGDTGINMCMTIFSAVDEMKKTGARDMKAVSRAISSGSLRGARGNSGVILSQLIRGFARLIANYDVIDKLVLCEAMQKACDTAYKAVMKPKEGTILTVARGGADKALELSCDDSCDMDAYIDAIIAEMERVLERTPDMLPVLKQAGVVDAGGQGLVEILKGSRDAYRGKEIDYSVLSGDEAPEIPCVDLSDKKLDTDDIKFGYCTEFIINLNNEMSEDEEDAFRSFLNDLGDSIVLVAVNDIVKIHVHTNDPGLVLQKALSYGSLSRIKIDNMREEHEEKLIHDADRLAKEQADEQEARAHEREAVQSGADSESAGPETETVPMKAVGFIAVAVGDGLREVFTEYGADFIIEGGQTMNPSTQDMLDAIEMVNAETVFIFPNNKNIIMAANQAADMTKDRQVIVIPTTSIPQGITAIINYIEESGVENNRDALCEVISTVKTGEVTYAVRDTRIDDLDIKKGDFMGLGDSGLLSAGKDMTEVASDMVAAMVDADSSFICIYYGEEISEEDANALAGILTERHPECEVEVQPGGQPVYYYIISVE
ncbi:MAG: DAK2 domain-containing protein [Clostridiales bacterium]|nr:DAK2 domain-containing protein [Clostridiales bacterium]